MLVFTAKPTEQGFINSTKFSWCQPNEILMFGLFQSNYDINCSMVGIDTRRGTTEIVVKNLNISKAFYVELVRDSLLDNFDCVIDSEGFFSVDVGCSFIFNIYVIVDDLIEKASQFKDGDVVICRGLSLTKV